MAEGTVSDFYNPPKIRTARKPHQCTYCAEAINAGESYTHQTGVYDSKWYEDKMHPECFEEFCYDDGGFTRYSNERPSADIKQRMGT